MDLIEDNKFQNAFLIYVSIDLFYEKNELENDYDEFKSLVISSGLEIKDCRNSVSYTHLTLPTICSV